VHSAAAREGCRPAVTVLNQVPNRPSDQHPVAGGRILARCVPNASRITVSAAIGEWQRFLAWDDFLRLGRSAGVYPRRILAGAAANGRRA